MLTFFSLITIFHFKIEIEYICSIIMPVRCLSEITPKLCVN